MKVQVLTAFLIVHLAVSAQTGNYFLSHYSPDEETFNMVCFDMVQDNRGVFYFATQAGILQFDGRNWDVLPAQGTIYSVAIDKSGQIYAAGSRGFGKIVRNEYGLETFDLLAKPDDAGYIFQIVADNGRVYFLGDQHVFVLESSSNEIRTISATPETGSFLSLNEVWGRILLHTEMGELFELSEGALVPSYLSLGGASLASSLQFGDNYLLMSDDNRLYWCDERMKTRSLLLQDSSYLKASGMINATRVNDQLIALGTLRGGIVFINPATGTTEEIINYSTGLPDNEVFNLITDRNRNVWASHAYGFTRISPFLPFRSFQNYPGLQGNLLCATSFNEEVYAGTSIGLFVLQRQEFFDEISYYVNVPVRKRTTSGQPRAETKTETSKGNESEKSGLLRFMRRRKSEEQQPASTPVQKQEEVTTFKRELRTEKILRSAHYSYRKIEGVDAKVSQLVKWKGKLFAAGLGGVYEIKGNSSVQITNNPIRFLFASEQRDGLIASTYDDRLVRFSFDGVWNVTEPIENINEPIHYIFEEGATSLWFCGFDKVFRFTDSEDVPALEKLSFSNANFDKTIGLYLNNEVIIASPSGFFFYNRSSRQLEKGDTLRKPVAYFANSGSLWFRDSHSWYTAGVSGGHENLQLLNLFNNLRFIDRDAGSGALWIITGNNELLQFNSGEVIQNETTFPLLLKAIRHEDIITARNYLKVEQDESAFVVEVVKPDYIGNRFVEYRYLLEGLHQDWSEWSTQNNLIRFPYLPSGDYQLKVQSRDIFGRIGEMNAVQLSITPPYWRQPWFYAAQFSVFIFLVMLSFRLSYRFLIVSRLLSLLSIIIFIEFIQTAAGETFSQSSPAIDFGIQVFVAMLILPVEGFLRRYFLQAIAKRNEARLRQSMLEGKIVAEFEPEIPEPSQLTRVKKQKK